MSNRIRTATLLLLMLFTSMLYAQEPYCWMKANLTMVLPFPVADANIEEDEEELLITREDLEIGLMLIYKDSVEAYFTDPLGQMINAMVDEFDLIVVSTPQKLPKIPSSQYIIAVDTAVFTDSLVVGILLDQASSYYIVAMFDCYESPLADALAIIKSFAFREAVKP